MVRPPALKWERVDPVNRLAYIVRQHFCDLMEPHKKSPGKVFRSHQGGHRNFLYLNAKVTACGLDPLKGPPRGERVVIAALSPFMDIVSCVVTHRGDVASPLYRD